MNISKAHKPDIESQKHNWNGRNPNLFSSDSKIEEQLDLRVRLAFFKGVIGTNGLQLLDEAIVRAFRRENESKYEELFREGNPELREVVAIAYYHYGNTEGNSLIRSYLNNLDLSKEESLAEQFVNQIENGSIKSYCGDWMRERQEIAEYLLPTDKIELKEEKESLDITPEQRNRLNEIYGQKIPTLINRPIREPPKPEFIRKEKERIQKSPLIPEEEQKNSIFSTDFNEDLDPAVFGEIKIQVPEEITDALGKDVRYLLSDELEEFKKDIENLKEKYHIHENYVDWLNNKEKEINRILDFRAEYGRNITSEQEVVEETIEIPILDPTPILPTEREITAEKEEQKLKPGKEIKENEKQFIREEQQRVEKSPIIPEEEQIAQEIDELERKIEKNVWTTYIPKDLSKSDSREFSSFNQRVEYKGTVEMFSGIEVPYKIREIRKGNRIEKYAFFDPRDNPFAEAIRLGKISEEEANLLGRISLAQRDVSILTMEYLDELAISAEYKKQGKIELAKVHQKEAEKILLDLESRNIDLEFEREKYSKLTGEEPEVLVVEETDKEVVPNVFEVSETGLNSPEIKENIKKWLLEKELGVIEEVDKEIKENPIANRISEVISIVEEENKNFLTQYETKRDELTKELDELTKELTRLVDEERYGSEDFETKTKRAQELKEQLEKLDDKYSNRINE